MNPTLHMTLDDAVGEVLNHLTGLDLHYVAELDRYRAIARTLNRALRLVSTEHEWSQYSAVEDLGAVTTGQTKIHLRSTVRPRIQLDDCLRLVDQNNCIHTWAYFLPRDALHKYHARTGLWVSHTRNELELSRPIGAHENGLRAFVPIMREPRQFIIPATLESVEELITPPSPIPVGAELIQLRNFHNPEIIEEWVSIPGQPPYEYYDPETSVGRIEYTSAQIRNQLLDFTFPDLIILKAAALYAATDPVMQPRVQTLEAQYKDLYYQLVERDTSHTDDPYRNDWQLPIEGNITDNHRYHHHPHSDERFIHNYR